MDNYSGVTQRRLRDGETAMGVSTTGETLEELEAARQAVHDGIAALQSTDDLGEDMNRRVYEQEQALWAKLKVLDGKIAEGVVIEAALQHAHSRTDLTEDTVIHAARNLQKLRGGG